MTFDDIASGDAVNIRTGTGETAVIARNSVKEKDGMRIIAWTTDGGDLITEANFLGFVGD
jgi:hypothetical protein